MNKLLYLLLEDGSVLKGETFGHYSSSEGEVVFNTGMVGYPETLTDPSYAGQILVMTYPLIGNYGVPPRTTENSLLVYYESERIHCKGLIVADYSSFHSHWNGEQSLQEWLKKERIPAVTGIDTRALTKQLRTRGTLLGRILTEDAYRFESGEHKSFTDPNETDLISEVSINQPKMFKKGKKKIVMVACGVKNSIIQAFLRRDISVLLVPPSHPFADEPANGYVISNGPGDPKVNKQVIAEVKKLQERNSPLLGICLGCQILGLAAGADTYKLKYGHRSHNQPVNEAGTNRCYITSQNHGYAIDSNTLPVDWRSWFVNDNDGTNEGIIHISKPFFGAQFHPEASPGPDDTEFIFDMFVRALQ